VTLTNVSEREDDYAEEITGDRTALHAKPASIGR
jgi:hypothetical protein